MKGIIFTEFLEMVETTFGMKVVDQIIQSSKLPTGGVYSSVGTYSHEEIVQLVIQLSKATEIPVPDLIRSFGKYLFQSFSKKYPIFFTGITSSFDFLGKVQGYIHVEVKKLYPEAELPTFETSLLEGGDFVMLYKSERGMADLAEGLIIGCVEYFNEKVNMQKEDLSGGKGKIVRFLIQKLPL